jgi:cell division protein ZapA
MSELININVIIADRPYPLKVRPDEEELVRSVARQINEKVRELQNLYSAKDKQDFLAMSALMNAVEIANLKKQIQDSESIILQQVTAIARLLQDTQ